MRWFLRFVQRLFSKKQSEDQEESYVTVDGFVQLASAGPVPDRSKLGKVTDEIVCISESGPQVTGKCGHQSASDLSFDVYGSKITGSGKHFCAECSIEDIRQNVIRCALCGHAILP